MISQKEKRFRKLIKKAERIAILSHIDSDHDSLCSSLALQRMLILAGKTANVYLDEQPKANFSYIAEGKTFLSPDDQQYDLAVVLDLASVKRIGACASILKNAKHVINIDHHQEEEDFADLVFRTTAISSACEFLFWLTRKLLPYDDEVARLIYIGMYADSGGFIYSSVSAKTFLCLSELYKFNNQYDQVVRLAFNKHTLNEFNLIKRAMDSVRFYLNGRLGVSFLSVKDFKDTNTNRADAKFIVSFLQRMETVEISVNISEDKPKDYRISIRTSCEGIDVSKIARAFGGGGHVRASGFGAKGEYIKVLDKIIALCEKELPKKES